MSLFSLRPFLVVSYALTCALASATTACKRDVAPAPAPAAASVALLPPPSRCEAGECNTRGMQALGLGRRDEAIVLLDRACAAGHAVGCSNLAGVYRGGAGVARGAAGDPQRAVGLYDRSCRLGFAEACATVGTMLVEGTAVAADPARALAMFELACGKKDPNACFTAGLLHEEGRGGAPRDPQRAATAFGSACEVGHATGCYNAGILLFRELGARPGENEQAVGYFERACEGAQPAGCLRVGLAALRGVGAAEDRGRAAVLFARACEGGDADGCHAAEQLKRARGRKVEIALTTRTPSFSIGGLSVRDLSCRMPQTDPMALAEAVEGLAVHKPELDACAPAGEAAAVDWSYRGGKTGDVRVRVADAKIAACVRKAVERARSSLTASCAATLLIGEPTGARRVYAERRTGPGASAPGRTATATR